MPKNFWVDRRVADEAAGYPASEARFISKESYVEHLEEEIKDLREDLAENSEKDWR